MPLLTDKQILNHAEFLYNVYCRAVGNRSFNGDPLPSWAALCASATEDQNDRSAKVVGAWQQVAIASLSPEDL